jgi:hypothetical protein
MFFFPISTSDIHFLVELAASIRSTTFPSRQDAQAESRRARSLLA